MPFCLGIDTSNYTTSAALAKSETGEITQKRRLLEVKSGSKGLQQSNAVFQHVRALPELLEELMPGVSEPLLAVGASVRPRDLAGSYMPCFKVGEGSGRSLAAALHVPFYGFSHQAGHIAAALFSIGRMELLGAPLVAFHVSGGTTEAVRCTPESGGRFQTEVIAQSLDLKAGQLIDRTGLLLGLAFPAGPALETLAAQSSRVFQIRPTMKGLDCCLSGVENQCARMAEQGEEPKDVAAYCLQSVCAAIDRMTRLVLKQFPGVPLVFAGGVMSNTMIRETIGRKVRAFFAAPGFSADNAAGIAALTRRQVLKDEE